MTAGQRLIEEGRQEGRLQGFKEALLRLLRQRFHNQVDSAIEQRVAEAPTEQIEDWFQRVLSASTLSELFDH